MKFKLMLLIMIALLILGCTDPDATSPSFNILTGTVTNSSGDLIEGAKILFTYETEEIVEKSETSITFSTDKTAQVQLWVANHRENNNKKTLVNAIYPAGSHTVVWDGTNANGLRVLPNYYDIKLRVDTLDTQTRSITFFYDDIEANSYDTQEAMTITNTNGYYEINVLRKPFFYTDNVFADSETGNGVKISKTVDVWAITSNGLIKKIESINIDENHTQILDIVLDD